MRGPAIPRDNTKSLKLSGVRRTPVLIVRKLVISPIRIRIMNFLNRFLGFPPRMKPENFCHRGFDKVFFVIELS
jgi:hypothetical protein